jgi:pimeloyl-ACP methyl ester carboxylesterase
VAAPTFTPRAPRVAFEDRGRGEPGAPALLLLTGWCSSRERWAKAAPLLGRHHRVVSFDWRGHGDSEADGDFGNEQMLLDALAVVEAAGLSSFVPCAASHSGWIAIELRRRFPERVPALVHLDWMVQEPPRRYTEVIEQLTSPTEWRLARDTLFEIWRADVATKAINRAFETMAAHDGEMWMRSGREIGAAYRRHGSPLAAWSALDPPPPVLHAYGQPPAPEYLAAQESFAAANPWFEVRRLPAASHFAMLEAPAAVDAAIGEFLG